MFLLLTLTGNANEPVAVNVENITDIRHHNSSRSDLGCDIYTVGSSEGLRPHVVSVQETFEDVISQLGNLAG